jgi:hypothetical protein
MAKDTVYITGTGFSTNPVYNFVSFEADAGIVISSTATKIKVVLPDKIYNKSVKVKVAVRGVVPWSNSLSFAFKDSVTIVPPEEGE